MGRQPAKAHEKARTHALRVDSPQMSCPQHAPNLAAWLFDPTAFGLATFGLAYGRGARELAGRSRLWRSFLYDLNTPDTKEQGPRPCYGVRQMLTTLSAGNAAP
jgi:hypothetical protein